MPPTMLFNLFSRRQDTQPQPMSSPTPATTPDLIHSEPVQLRTPSPSVESMNAAGPSTPPLSAASHRGRSRPMSPLQNSLSLLAVRSDTASPDSTQTLYRLISSVPAKTLHAYTLAHVRQAPPSTLAALTAFYSNLQPPPRLHCVRCHGGYVDIENGDRSCLIPHDDESALVERVGRTARRDGAEYETLWQCCGKTVEGDGDQGPPDGWCYEGKHTTDLKRARFRADSTPQHDKLISCLRKNCDGLRAQMPRRSVRNKRTRSIKGADSDDNGSDGGESHMDVDESVSAIGSVRGRTKRKAPTKSTTETRAKSTDARPSAKPKSTRRAASVSAKPKTRSRKSAAAKEASEEELEEDVPKKRRKVAA